MDGGSLAFILFVAVICITIMWNRYQWRKSWEAYYKRQHKAYTTPDGRSEEAEETS